MADFLLVTAFDEDYDCGFLCCASQEAYAQKYGYRWVEEKEMVGGEDGGEKHGKDWFLFICQNQSIMLNVIFDRFCAMVNNPAKFKNMVSCFLRFWFLFICWIVFWMFVFESLIFFDAFLIFWTDSNFQALLGVARLLQWICLTQFIWLVVWNMFLFFPYGNNHSWFMYPLNMVDLSIVLYNSLPEGKLDATWYVINVMGFIIPNWMLIDIYNLSSW